MPNRVPNGWGGLCMIKREWCRSSEVRRSGWRCCNLRFRDYIRIPTRYCDDEAPVSRPQVRLGISTCEIGSCAAVARPSGPLTVAWMMAKSWLESCPNNPSTRRCLGKSSICDCVVNRNLKNPRLSLRVVRVLLKTEAVCVSHLQTQTVVTVTSQR